MKIILVTSASLIALSSLAASLDPMPSPSETKTSDITMFSSQRKAEDIELSRIDTNKKLTPKDKRRLKSEVRTRYHQQRRAARLKAQADHLMKNK